MMVVLLLALAGFVVSTLAAIVLAVLYFRHVTPFAGVGDGDSLVQKETVSPKSSFTGIVYYPVPYAAPPNLKLTTAQGFDTVYDIVKQDETGFTWTVHPVRGDFQDDNMLFRIQGKEYPDFTWEAKGVRVSKDAESSKIVPQEGIFNTVAGQEAEVHFPSPYRTAPNVELETGGGFSQAYMQVIIVETTPTGFKWKNVGKDATKDSGHVKWKAKGVLAK
jgi:hypothetical protein